MPCHSIWHSSHVPICYSSKFPYRKLLPKKTTGLSPKVVTCDYLWHFVRAGRPVLTVGLVTLHAITMSGFVSLQWSSDSRQRVSLEPIVILEGACVCLVVARVSWPVPSLSTAPGLSRRDGWWPRCRSPSTFPRILFTFYPKSRGSWGVFLWDTMAPPCQLTPRQISE